jgi:tetratricopeptide (TPR) repeat protein
VQADRKTLSRHASGKATGTWELTGPYARIGDLELAPDGDIYLTDTPGRRIFAVSDDLKSAKRFRLYESLLQTPTRLTSTADRLWLVDEGRKAVMQFRLRTAETAWEHALLGEEYLALSLHEAALRELEIARGLGLSMPDLELNVGIALYGLGRYQDALTTWRKLGDIPETQDVMGLWRGNALFRLGRYEDAVRAYDAVREESADGTRAVFNLGQARLALGQYGPAKMQFQRLLQRVPGNAFAKVGLARAHIGLGEIERAVPLLVEVASEGPAADVARYHLGHLRLTTGEVEAALPLLERAAKQGPYFRAALRDLIEANRRLGDTERARFYEQRLESLREDTDTLAAFILEDRL